MTVRFRPSAARTLGVEVELGVVSVETGELVPATGEIIAALMRDYPDEAEHPTAKHELFLSTIEIITGVCPTPADAYADLRATLAELRTELDPRGLTLMGGGVHPFAEPRSLLRSPSERYDQVVERVQWPARRLQIHGVHFHVGVLGNGDNAIAVLNGLMRYLPLFVALSAASPFWEAEDTGLASVRTKIFESMPTAGLPSYFPDWAGYEQFAESMIAAGSIGSIREIWWDIRPHIGYGTLEFRMCDGMATLREIISLAALAQCLVEYLEAKVDAGEAIDQPVGWIIRENKWRAARFGLEAELMDERGRTWPIRAEIDQVVSELLPIAEKLGCAEQLRWVREILDHGASYARQRAVTAAGGSLRDVVTLLANEFAADRIGG